MLLSHFDVFIFPVPPFLSEKKKNVQSLPLAGRIMRCLRRWTLEKDVCKTSCLTSHCLERFLHLYNGDKNISNALEVVVLI